MAEIKKFILEGAMTLAYFTGERDSKQVLIEDKDATSDGPETVAVSQRRLESKICDELGFPNDTEFDEMFKKLDELRKKGLRPVEGVPDKMREDVRLRITVEVLVGEVELRRTQ